MVSVKLMQQGWNVLNANASITNFESIDLVCINPETDEISLVQVKTCWKRLKDHGYSFRLSAKGLIWNFITLSFRDRK